MKNTFRFFALAAVVAAFASCDKVETVNQPVKNNISIRIGTETKSLLRNGTEVHWSNQDKIRVFDDANVGFKFETTQSDVATAVFTCTDEGGWTGGVPVMAIHSYRPTVNQTAFDGTKVTANIYQNQMIHHNGSYARDGSLSIGVVGKEGSDYVVNEMKNCFSLIKFQLENKDITSVKMRGNNNEILAGWVNVSYNSGNPTWEVDGNRGEKEITITPGSNAGHSSNSTNTFFAVNDIDDNNDPVEGVYYIAVLPQTLASGLEIKLTKSNGSVATRTINSSIVLNRSKIKAFENSLDKDLTFETTHEPIILDCTDASKFVWESSDPFPTRNAKASAAFDFWLNGHTEYEFNGNVYNWDKHLSWEKGKTIKLPNISGYSLVEMSVTSQKSSNTPTYTITDGTTTLASASINKNTSTFPVVFDVSAHPQSSTSPDRYLSVSDYEGCIKFILTYTKVSE